MSVLFEFQLRPTTKDLLDSTSGQSLMELALILPILILLVAYAVDFGYFFIVEAAVTSSSRNAAQYASDGFQSAGQTTLPPAGPSTLTNSISAEAIAGLASLNLSSTTTSVEACTKANGVNNNVAQCTAYGPSATGYAPDTDPEAPHFVLQRVDVTYTVQPPVPLQFFSIPILPVMRFHRQVSMRALD